MYFVEINFIHSFVEKKYIVGHALGMYIVAIMV
jgi:hypothetical protein